MMIRTDPTGERFGRRELFVAALYTLILVWVNAYICRELFQHEAARMNSMHGFWIALAKLGPGSWFHPAWWPFWDCGIPFEFTYAPLVPALTAFVATMRGVSEASAFQSVSGLFYCLAPVTMFLMAWLLTRAAGYSFLAGLFYSLTAPAHLITPEAPFSVSRFLEPRRFYLTAVWDETPHLAALSLLPLVVLLLSLAIRKRRFGYYVATIVLIVLAAMTSAFGPAMVGMAALCLMFTAGRSDYMRSFVIVLTIAGLAYAIAAPFLPPSLLVAIRDSSSVTEGGWNIGSLTALAGVALGWTIVCRYLPRWTDDWRLQFFALFAYLTASIPVMATFFHRQFLPQPLRYKNEMEFALSLFIVFAARKWLAKAPVAVRATLLLLFLAIAAEQVVSQRKFAKAIFFAPHDLTRTVEYRVSKWVEQNLPGVRVMMPGSAAQWANAFAGIQQLTGSSWSTTYNEILRLEVKNIFNGGKTAEEDARVSLTWLKAYGVGAIGISGPLSSEFWKPFLRPAKFRGLLPELWSEEDLTLYQVPRRNASLAHVVSESALVTDRGTLTLPSLTAVEQYVTAIENASQPAADFDWQGRGRIRIRTAAGPAEVLSVQVSYHPGWHATVNGQARDIKRDGLGLFWLRPACDGPCDVQLNYDGGWELRVCRWLSFAAMSALLLLIVYRCTLRVAGKSR